MVEDAQHRLASSMPEGMTLIRALGTSPLSEVFLVRDKDGLFCALKVMRASVAKDPSIVARWNREAETLTSLSHPNLVHCFGSCLVDGRPGLILEYISGGTMRELLEEEPVSWETACRFGIQISRALDYLHRNGAIHRDVKPHNILIHPHHGAVVADLGLVLRDEDPTLTRHGAALGSPAYMSPEQSRNPSDVCEQTDIYSLGATLYHAITGRPPFVGKGVGEVIHRVLHEKPEPIGREVPEALKRIIGVSMSKDEEQRYDRARSMGTDLGRVLLGYKPRLRTLRTGIQLRKRVYVTAIVLSIALLGYFNLPLASSPIDSDDGEVVQKAVDSAADQSPRVSPQQIDSAANSVIDLPLTTGFAKWVAKDAAIFYSYVQSRKLHAAETLLAAIESRSPESPATDFSDDKEKWLAEARIQIRAAAEGLAAVALNLLEQASLETQIDAAKGVYEQDKFDSKVAKLWRAANVDIGQLSVAAGHPDVRARQLIVKQRLENIFQQAALQGNNKLLDEIVTRTRPLLEAGDFVVVRKQFELLPRNFVSNDIRAQRYIEQASALEKIQARFAGYLAGKVGLQVEFAAKNQSLLIGTLAVDEQQRYFVDYRQQTRVALNLLDLEARALLNILGEENHFELALLLRAQRLHAQSVTTMQSFAGVQPTLAHWWLSEWQKYQVDEQQPPSVVVDVHRRVAIAPAKVVRLLQGKFPEAKVTYEDELLEVRFDGFTTSGDFLLDFASVNSQLVVQAWQLDLLCQSPSSVPQLLTLQDEIIFTKAGGVLSSSVEVQGNYMHNKGLRVSSAVQSIVWRNQELLLDGVRLAPWKSEQRQLSIASDDNVLAVSQLVVSLRLD